MSGRRVHPLEVDLDVFRVAMIPDDVRGIPAGHLDPIEVVDRITLGNGHLAQDVMLPVQIEVDGLRRLDGR